jgi:hypothetical protein
VGEVGDTTKFFVEIIKPSHYDDDGFVIQWRRAFVPSNSLASLYALVQDVQERALLGDEVEIVVNAYDEIHSVIPTREIVKRLRPAAKRGVVLLAGVQSNQFPRAVDLARDFLAADIPVVIGGFHVSGCIAMLPDLPDDIKAAQGMGIALFAGEAEGRMGDLLRDAYRGELQPIYNFMHDLPALRGQITPLLPPEVSRRYLHFTPFDAGRGCPFQCSFCTIINVQGRKSRYRDADDVEKLVRSYVARGIDRFFITDDNMARNKNWEAIFDRLIWLREEEGVRAKFVIQVDAMCHKLPGFIEKAARAGCTRVFIGLESINPDALASSKKHQNKITEYRAMLQAWRSRRVVTFAGYILGFPNDTPESIERDIGVIQRELPIDILEFFVLTPLPGSQDHKELHERGVWMDPDMNQYDLEHVTLQHASMSKEQLQEIYDRAWHLYYSPEHIETLFRRAEATGSRAHRVLGAIVQYYGSYRFHNVHPLQCGILRTKSRATMRPGARRPNPVSFYLGRIGNTAAIHIAMAGYYLKLEWRRQRIKREVAKDGYVDLSLTPVEDDSEQDLQLFTLTDGARQAAAKSDRAERRRKAARAQSPRSPQNSLPPPQ